MSPNLGVTSYQLVGSFDELSLWNRAPARTGGDEVECVDGAPQAR